MNDLDVKHPVFFQYERLKEYFNDLEFIFNSESIQEASKPFMMEGVICGMKDYLDERNKTKLSVDDIYRFASLFGEEKFTIRDISEHFRMVKKRQIISSVYYAVRIKKLKKEGTGSNNVCFSLV